MSGKNELFYIEKGDGFPLILLHGNGENHEYFCRQIECFSAQYRVIALDTRGHGGSPRGDGEFTIRRFAEDLYAFMTAHKIAKAHLLGFSDGANIAMYFAMSHPQMVEKLILNGGNISPAGVRCSTQIPIEIGYRIAKRFALKSPKARSNAEMLGLMVNEPHISPSELGALDIPTLVIAGTRDMIKRGHTELIARSIPRAKLVLIHGGHFIANKSPDEFNAAVDSFLKG